MYQVTEEMLAAAMRVFMDEGHACNRAGVELAVLRALYAQPLLPHAGAVILSAQDGAKVNCPGAIVTVVVPSKWIGFVHPDHPAYSDLLNRELAHWSVKDLRETYAMDGNPQIMREYIKVELARRKVKV